VRKFILITSDLLAVVSAFALSLLIRFGGLYNVERNQWSTLFILVVIYPIVLYFFDLYNPFIFAKRIKLFFTLVKTLTILIALYVFAGFISKSYFLIASRSFIILFFALLFVCHFMFRLLIAPWLIREYSRNPSRRAMCLFIGPREKFRQIRKFCDTNSLIGFNLIHETDRKEKLPPVKYYFLYSLTEDFSALYKEIRDHIKSGHTLFVLSTFFNDLNINQEWCEFDDMPVYTFSYRSNQKLRDTIRRLIDIIGSLFLLIALTPVFLVIAIAIKIDSPGPMIYKQKRCGKDGKIFTFYKFRSMFEHERKDEIREVEFKGYIEQKTTKGKVINHKDITNIGRVIRKTSIDELPQFFNVLKGEMSLIGPRPPIPYEVKYYKDWHKDRLSIKPGLSGLWQIYGRGNMPCDSSIFLDLMYVINRSITLDIRLMFQTLPAVLFGRGAY
jgi:undecaprenyl-phosphate galactose phosphotransferase